VVATVDEIKAFFRSERKTVVTFVGFSGAGYENPDRMQAEAAAVLDRYAPATTIVNIGATADGIGAVYDVARDELAAARRGNKDVRFIPADMNHRKAIEAALRKGLPTPTEFRGSAHALFGS